jgi:hypothetical protein
MPIGITSKLKVVVVEMKILFSTHFRVYTIKSVLHIQVLERSSLGLCHLDGAERSAPSCIRKEEELKIREYLIILR